MQGADEDHGHHTGEEEDDHGAVGDAEPVDLVVGVAPASTAQLLSQEEPASCRRRPQRKDHEVYPVLWHMAPS